MGKMKRVFSLVLALVMVLGTFGTVFAADEPAATVELKKVPTDVMGTEYEVAVSRLVAFGVLEGFPDGEYKAENDVTRAEFAKILVESLGIGNAAKAALGKTVYPDVPASHWAAGYISVASGQGLIEGYPNGEFRPSNQVTYAEALTMLVRALGYKDEFLMGDWPGSHIAKAAEAGITAGVNYSDARGFANRGKVAQMVNNGLDADVVRVKTYADGRIEYETTEITLLKEKLNISKYEDTRLIADKILDDGLNKDEVKILFTKDIDKDDDSVHKSYRANDDKVFTVKNDMHIRKLMGEEVTTYMNNRDEVVYVESENDDTAKFDYVYRTKTTELNLVKFDKDYKFDKDAKVYVFNSSNDEYDYVTGADLQNDLDDLGNVTARVGKFVVRNNRIVFAEIMDSSEANPWLVVLKNDDGQIEGVNRTTEDFKLDLREDGTYDLVFAYDLDGNKMDVKDIEAGNLLYAQAQDYDGDDAVVVRVVTDNKVEGEVGRFREDRVEIGGSFKTVVKFYDTTTRYNDSYYSVDTLEDIEQWQSSNWETDLDDANGEEVVAYLDAVGRIAFMSTDVEASSGYKYGVVTRTYADKDRVKIFTSLDGKDSEEITFRADREANLSKARKITFNASTKKFVVEDKNDASATEILGAAVKFKLNKDGEISKDEFYVMDKDAVFTMDADFGRDTMRTALVTFTGNQTVNQGTISTTTEAFSIKGNATIIDAENLNPRNTLYSGTNRDIELDTNVDIDDFSVVSWEDMRNTKKNTDIRFYVFPKNVTGLEVDGMIFVGTEGANTASDREAIYVRDRWRSGDDIVIEYIAYGSDERLQAKVDGTNNIEDIGRRVPYVAEMRSNGKVKVFGDKLGTLAVVKDKDTYFEGMKAKVEEISGNRITLAGKTYTLDSSAIVYDGGDKKTTSNIRKGDGVHVIIEDKVTVRVVQLGVTVAAAPGTPITTDGTVTYINADATAKVTLPAGANVADYAVLVTGWDSTLTPTAGAVVDQVNTINANGTVNFTFTNNQAYTLKLVKTSAPGTVINQTTFITNFPAQNITTLKVVNANVVTKLVNTAGSEAIEVEYNSTVAQLVSAIETTDAGATVKVFSATGAGKYEVAGTAKAVNPMIVEVTAKDGTTVVEYPITAKTGTDAGLTVIDANVASLSVTDITVDQGTTVAELLAAIKLDDNKATIKALSKAAAGTELTGTDVLTGDNAVTSGTMVPVGSDQNILRVTAQDGTTVVDYDVLITPVTLSSVKTIKSLDLNKVTTAGTVITIVNTTDVKTAADLLALIETIDANATIKVLGAAGGTEVPGTHTLVTGTTVVLVTAEDGTTQAYTLN